MCRKCGQEINVFAKVCGWCKTPVDESSTVSVVAGGMTVAGGILGGAIGFAFDPSGVLAGLAATVGGAIGYVWGRSKGNDLADRVRDVREADNAVGQGCSNCGYDPGYDVSKTPGRYCSNCGKRFGS